MHNEQALKELLTAHRIGVLRTDRLGDMVLTLPLLQALHEQFPSASLELITRRYCQDLVQDLPFLSAVHYLDGAPLSFVLQEHLFDVLFFPRPVASEAWQAFRAAVPLRVGSAYRWYSALFNARIHDHRSKAEYHEAEYNVRMVDMLTGNTSKVNLVRPIVSDSARKDMEEIVQREGLDLGRSFVIVHPGSGNSAIEWGAENFGRCAAQLSAQSGLQIVISGTEAEASKCATVAGYCPQAINLCGRLTLSRLMPLIERTEVLIANSTGVLHVAAALGRAVVGLYPNSPTMSAARWGPYTSHSRVLCPPSSHDAQLNDQVSLINVEDVVQAVQDVRSHSTESR